MSYSGPEEFFNYIENFFKLFNLNKDLLCINNYTNNNSEVCNYIIDINIKYTKILIDSYYKISNFSPSFSHCADQKFSLKNLEEAKRDLLESLEKSLRDINEYYTCAGIYYKLIDNHIPNLKFNIKTNELHIDGLLISKNIILGIPYKQIKKSAISLAKDFIKNDTQLCNWRQFKISPYRFSNLSKT